MLKSTNRRKNVRKVVEYLFWICLTLLSTKTQPRINPVAFTQCRFGIIYSFIKFYLRHYHHSFSYSPIVFLGEFAEKSRISIYRTINYYAVSKN